MKAALGLVMLLASLNGTIEGKATNDTDYDNPPSSEQSFDGNHPTLTTPHGEDIRDRVVIRFVIGRSSNNWLHRQVGRNMPGNGWAHLVNQQAIPKIAEHGLRRVQLHNPFGAMPGWMEPMQFDQLIDAKDAKLDWLTEGFSEAWQPVQDQGVEIISYIGSPRLDEDSKQWIERAGEDSWRENYAWPAVAPIVDSGMNLGYDAAGGATKDSPTYRFSQALLDRGVKVYIEASPPADYDWWFDFPVIVIEETWQDRKDHPDWAGPDDLTGEMLRIVRVSPEWFDENPDDAWPERACRVLAEGDTVILSDNLFRSAQRTLEGLNDCAWGHYEANS